MQALYDQPSLFANSEDSTTSGSGHRHPARWAMLKSRQLRQVAAGSLKLPAELARDRRWPLKRR